MSAVRFAILLIFVVAITMVNASDNEDGHARRPQCWDGGNEKPCDPRNGSRDCKDGCDCKNRGKRWTCQ
uniref:Uncharacterized protein n=1 Tax=Rhipicephalus zambeziensis TaxID=60191 RepID=A0A224YHL0_9ACAR